MENWVPRCQVGDRIRITGPLPEEPNPIPVGTEGTVNWVGSFDQYAVDWDDNASALILLGTDPFEVLPGD